MSTIGPGKEVGGVQVICWSPIDDRHVVTGSCHQSRDGATVSPYAGVAIAQRPGETMAFLFYCDTRWRPVTDTFHMSIARAKEEAEREFNGVCKTWIESV